MKEAAGEANMTVITIVLIAIVLGVGTIIVNNMMRSSGQSTACTNAGGTWQRGQCFVSHQCQVATNGSMDCTGAPTMACAENNGVWNCN